MNVTVNEAGWKDFQADALILGVPAGQQALQGALAEADQALSGAISRVLADKQFTGKAAQAETLYPMAGLGAPRIVLVGLGGGAAIGYFWDSIST